MRFYKKQIWSFWHFLRSCKHLWLIVSPQHNLRIESVNDVCYKKVLWYDSSSFSMNQWEIFTDFFAMFMEVLRSTEAPVATGRKEWPLPKRENCSSVICVAQAILSQLLVLKCCSGLIPSLARVAASNSDILCWVFRSANEVSVTAFEILGIRRFFGT